MQKLILLNADRVYYRGLLGQPDERVSGALTLYASATGLLRISLANQHGPEPERAVEFAAVPPYTPHRVACEDGWVHCLLIEPEYLDLARLPDALHPQADTPDPLDLTRRLRDFGAWLEAHPSRAPATLVDFDAHFFATPLPRRTPDPRIASVIERMRGHPADAFTAQDGAELCGLSSSRFMHLFKAEAGASFRNFRTWKRARSLLERVSTAGNLTDLALDMGYPDATHFSHAIRHFYGLRPKDIVAGSRRLTRVGR